MRAWYKVLDCANYSEMGVAIACYFSFMLDNHTCIGRGRGLVDVDVLV